MRPMEYNEMQSLLTYLTACQPNGKMQQALSIRFREMWNAGDITATKWLADELKAVASGL